MLTSIKSVLICTSLKKNVKQPKESSASDGDSTGMLTYIKDEKL